MMNKTMKMIVGVIASLSAVAALAEATHVWQGGSGNWSDAANWSAGSVPGAESSVSIMPTTDVVITMPNSNITVDSLKFSTRDGAITFKAYSAASQKTLSVVNEFSMTGAANAKPLVFDQIKMTSSTSKITNLDAVEKLVVKNSSLICIDGAATIGSLYLSENSVIHNEMDTEKTKVITARELVAGCGYNRLRTYAEFDSYRDTKQICTIIVQDKAVKFKDASGIRLIGGTGTLEAPTSQIPITTMFNITGDNRDSYSLYTDGGLADRSFNFCTLDANGYITKVSTGTFKKLLEDVSEYDNGSLHNSQMI